VKSKNRIVLASVLGNAFAPLFATLFFPTYNSTTALLASLMTFAVGFFMRPLGGILFGHLGIGLAEEMRSRSLLFSWHFQPLP
jgi:hypothetical protein